MFKFIETHKSTYLCENVIEAGSKVKLVAATTITDRNDDPGLIAREYVKAKLMEKTRDVNVSIRSLESQEDAEDVSPLIELMLKYVPIAEKHARAQMIMKEVARLANIEDEDEDEDYE